MAFAIWVFGTYRNLAGWLWGEQTSVDVGMKAWSLKLVWPCSWDVPLQGFQTLRGQLEHLSGHSD